MIVGRQSVSGGAPIDTDAVAYPCIEAIPVQRLAHELYREDIPLIPRLMSEWAHSRTGIDPHAGARVPVSGTAGSSACPFNKSRPAEPPVPTLWHGALSTLRSADGFPVTLKGAIRPCH